MAWRTLPPRLPTRCGSGSVRSGTCGRSGRCAAPRCAKPLPGVMNPCGSTVWFDVVMSTETWVGVDGTMRERSVEVSQRFASPADRARWLASGKPLPLPVSIAQGDALDVGSGHFPSPQFEAIAPDVPPVEGPPTGAGPARCRRRPVHLPPAAGAPDRRGGSARRARAGRDGASPPLRARCCCAGIRPERRWWRARDLARRPEARAARSRS